MRIAVILGSQRRGGTSDKIEEGLASLGLPHELDFIRMAEFKVEACVACEKCSASGKCALPRSPGDMFEDILERLVASELIMLITPIYSPYPSRLTALMERLLSISFFPYMSRKTPRPLLGKKTAIICYGSSKIEDETQLKILFQKLLLDEYSFTEISYDYLNREERPNEKYAGVVEYAKDVLMRALAG